MALFALGISLMWTALPGAGNATTVIIRNLKGETLVIDLDRPQTVRIEGILGTTTIAIEAKGVRFVDSPCPHKLCIGKGRISRPGEFIACLPNGIVATINGSSEYDGITP